MTLKICAVALLVPVVAGCIVEDDPELATDVAEVQASQVDKHYALAQDGSWASKATAMLEVPIRGADGVQKTVASNAAPPLPAFYPVRGTCGVTFVSPHYAVTAAHCVSGTNVPSPTSIAIPVRSYDINGVTEQWTLLFGGNVSGTFPNYVPVGGSATAAEIPGYISSTTSCSVHARCSTAWGPKYNCSIEADIALLHCPFRSSAGPWLRIAASDPQSGPVEMYWFHEVLYMPTGPGENLDRFNHYTALTSQESNFHYLGSRTNAILPLKSIAWPGGQQRQRTGPAYGGTGTDLFGCHGTSGSGVLGRNAQTNQLELLGPAVQASPNWNGRLCTDPDPTKFAPGAFNISYTTNATTRQLEQLFLYALQSDRGELPPPPKPQVCGGVSETDFACVCGTPTCVDDEWTCTGCGGGGESG